MTGTANTALRVTELDFDSVRNNLKNFLRSQSEFEDYDFEGSGMAVLLDILAYNTHYMAFYANMIGNEMFLDSAQLRQSVLSHAKSIGYVPNSRVGATAIVNIQATPSTVEDQTATTATLEKYTRFLGEDIDGTNHTFVNLYSNTVTKSAGSFTFANVALKQGEVITQQFVMTADNSKRTFNLGSANIDTSTLVVSVQESSSNLDTRIYTVAEDITDATANSLVYFLEENSDLKYSIIFGDNIIGKTPRVGNIITATYLDTVGSGANSISKFTLTGKLGGKYRDNVTISTVQSSFGGGDKESTEDVRFRAPYAYTTQNRAVTSRDYESIILRDFPIVESATVWGGEDNDPVIYGKVFMSLKTRQNYALSNIEKERITDTLIRNRNVVTVIPEFVDPDYTYVMVSGKVYYASTQTSKTSDELSQLVRAAIIDYSETELDRFSGTFRKSKLQKYIEAADPAITGSDIQINIQKRLYLDVNNTKSYSVTFNMPLRKGSFVSRLKSFPAIYTADSNGVEREVYFEEVLNAPTGINSIVITNQGYSYTEVPTVTIIGDGSGATATARIAGGKVVAIDIVDAGSNYTTATAVISGGNGAGCTATVNLENNYSTIRSFYYTTSGDKITIRDNAGTIKFDTGDVVLSSVRATGAVSNDFYPDDYLTVVAPAGAEVIAPVRNRILVIDYSDAKSIQIEMVTEN